MTIWTPTQHPFVLQRVVAAALKWPIARVRIVAPDPGGGFGGKGWPKFEPLLAVLALRLGRPVRLVLTLEETFQAARRTSARIHARTGFDRDGRIVSQDLNTDFLIGAYADIGVRVVSKASYAACGPYRTPNAKVTARALLSHTTPSTAFRGFGTPQASWAVESQLTEAAGDPRHRSGRDSTPQSAAQRRSLHSERHAGGRRLAAALASAERVDRLACAAGKAPGPRYRARAEEFVHGLGVSGDRAPSLRRAACRCCPARPTWDRVRGPFSRRSPARNWASVRIVS